MEHSSKQDRRPSQQWYWDAWFNDKAVRLCGLAARGLWKDMLGIMWESPERGVLLKPNGSTLSAKDLAKLVGATTAMVSKCLRELARHGVYSRDEQGRIYNRRLVREWHLSHIRAEAGRKGGLASAASKCAKQTATESSAPSPSPSSTSIPPPQPPAANPSARLVSAESLLEEKTVVDRDVKQRTDEGRQALISAIVLALNSYGEDVARQALSEMAGEIGPGRKAIKGHARYYFTIAKRLAGGS